MQFKKKNSSHLRQGKAGGMNGNQQRSVKQNGLRRQGAKPVALEGAALDDDPVNRSTPVPIPSCYIFTPNH